MAQPPPPLQARHTETAEPTPATAADAARHPARGAPVSLRPAALQALALADPTAKCAAVRALWASASAGCLHVDADEALTAAHPLPGRPQRPQLVSPDRVPRRSPHTAAGRAALLHAVAHIEFNAIDLALDAIWRFAGLPEAYYRDWLRVAHEESQHFALLAEHLATLGHAYGDFDAHDGLWAMTTKTADDVLARMALVPRTLEARGLDATPPMQARLRAAGDLRAVEILGVILRDEVGHVAIGNRWYRWLCERAGLDPLAHYPVLAARYGAPRLKPPFNLEARSAAGFTAEEIQALAASAPG
jgi:uncharacterized ferritin-like protein (DUF455 family)